jgi:hypothetical protein
MVGGCGGVGVDGGGPGDAGAREDVLVKKSIPMSWHSRVFT